MNTKLLLTLFLLMAAMVDRAHAQFTDVLNNNINFEFRVQDNLYDGVGDASDEADPTILNDFWLSDGGGWFGWQCYSWDCFEPCYNYDNPTGVWGTGWPFTVEFQITMQAFESDNPAPNSCVYTEGDDDYWNGNATLRNGQIQMPVVYPSTDFRPCNWNPWLASGTGWIFPNAGAFNQIWAETWRYTAGDESTDPLSFGTIQIGETKSDINATRSVESNSGQPLSYTNTANNESADVWYTFSLDEPSDVLISTASSVTDYDTYLRLYTVAGDFIAQNDDAGGQLTSQIEESLYPGNYLIQVEGYATSTGLFELDVQVSGNTSSLEEEESLARKILLYPNPSAGLVTLDLSQVDIGAEAMVQVQDMTGKTVYSQRLGQAPYALDLSELESGQYLLIFQDHAARATKKLTIQR